MRVKELCASSAMLWATAFTTRLTTKRLRAKFVRYVTHHFSLSLLIYYVRMLPE